MLTLLKRKVYSFATLQVFEQYCKCYLFFVSDGNNNNKINNKNNTSTSNKMETERQERNNDTGR